MLLFLHPFGHSSDAMIKLLLQKDEPKSAVGVKLRTDAKETNVHALR